MSHLIVAAFDDEFKAEHVRLDLIRMQRKDLVDLEEAAVAIRNSEGKVKLHHVSHFTFPLAISGGFVGTLAGLLVLNPALAAIGMVVGTGAGAVLGALKEIGIEEEFMQEIASHLKPGSSALFILVKSAKPEVVSEELKRFKGKLLQTTLSHTDESKLRAALDEAARNAKAGK